MKSFLSAITLRLRDYFSSNFVLVHSIQALPGKQLLSD
jgi:hypothetical protein